MNDNRGKPTYFFVEKIIILKKECFKDASTMLQ